MEFEALIARSAAQLLTRGEVDAFCETSQWTLPELLDRVAYRVGHDYLSATCDWEFGVNALYLLWVTTGFETPAYFYEVLCAFERGEKLPPGTDPDPVCRPLVAARLQSTPAD